MSSPDFASLLRCCHCGGVLAGEVCASCGRTFPSKPNGPRDLRPRSVLVQNVAFEVDPADPLWSSDHHAEDCEIAPRPLQLRSLIPRSTHGGYALEIGVGHNSLRAAIESAGWTFIGVDYCSDEADFLVDVHALPFATGTFSLVVCSALLEHVRYPHLAINEIARVAATGGTVIGVVALLQPFHMSYFHMTHEAVRDSFRGAALRLTALGRDRERYLPYLTTYAGLLPRVCNLLLRVMVTPADLVFALLLKLKQAVTKRPHDGSIGVGVGIVFAATKTSDARENEQ